MVKNVYIKKKPLVVVSGYSKNEDLKMSFFRIGFWFLSDWIPGFFSDWILVSFGWIWFLSD